MEIFDRLTGKDEPIYHEWRRMNPDGFVVNTARSNNPEYFVVHRPSCWTISRPTNSRSDKPFTGEAGYIKICSTDAAELMREARRRGRAGPLQYCKICKPDLGNQFLTELSDPDRYSAFLDGDPLLRASLLARERGRRFPEKVQTATVQFLREPSVASYAKLAAKGACSLCGERSDMDPMSFLDCHHIIFLRDGGSDTRENVVGVCPNCHRRLHISPERETVARLRHLALTRAAELDEVTK